jgi:hypothetical protein
MIIAGQCVFPLVSHLQSHVAGALIAAGSAVEVVIIGAVWPMIRPSESSDRHVFSNIRTT